jgi:hypothetical protein
VHFISRQPHNKGRAAEPEVLARLTRALSRSTRFSTGKGRTGRLLISLLPVRLGYQSIIYKGVKRVTCAGCGEFGPCVYDQRLS